MSPGDLFAGAGALGMLGISLGSVVWSHGRHAARIDSAASDIKALDVRVAGLEQLKVAVEGLQGGVEHLVERMADGQKLAASELGRLSDNMAGGQKLMEAQLASLAQMTDREIGEVKENVRAIRAAFDGQRHVGAADPPPATRRRGRAGAP